jgi:hypothetical protein
VRYIFPPPVENTTKKPIELPPITKVVIPSAQTLTDPSTISSTTIAPTTTPTTTNQPATTQPPANTTSCINTHCKKLNF